MDTSADGKTAVTCDFRKALDLASDGKWDAAHKIVQEFSDPMACRIHGYLHQLEGDLENAQYWYGQAGEDLPKTSLDKELKRLYRMVSTP